MSRSVHARVPLVLLMFAAIVSTVLAQSSGTVAERRARIEAGLLPATGRGAAKAPAMRLDERMVFYKVPAVSVAVIDDGRLAWAHAWGVANSDTKASVTTYTMFQAASISKPVAAIVAMAMVRQGTIALDDDVNSRLKSWRLGFAPDISGPATIRHLLTHTAGTTVHGFRGYDRTENVPTTLQVLDGVPPSNSSRIVVDQTPGEQWRYSGGGYTVLQQLMEDVSKRPFAELAKTTVLEPLEMSRSTYEQPLPDKFHSSAATGHLKDGRPMPGSWGIHPELAAAGLWTTPSDLARVALEVQRGMTNGQQKVLTRELTIQMLTVFKGNQGIGFGVNGEGKSLRFSHGGSNRGYRCQLIAFATAGKGAVIMTNGDGGGQLAAELQRAIAKEYGWPEGS